jgi:hypothetical protein
MEVLRRRREARLKINHTQFDCMWVLDAWIPGIEHAVEGLPKQPQLGANVECGEKAQAEVVSGIRMLCVVSASLVSDLGPRTQFPRHVRLRSAGEPSGMTG